MVEGEDGEEDYDDDEDEDYGDDEDDREGEDEDESEGEMLAFALELFEQLRGKDDNLAVSKFKTWPEVVELIKEKIITG